MCGRMRIGQVNSILRGLRVDCKYDRQTDTHTPLYDGWIAFGDLYILMLFSIAT